jgi:hypothetical protein
VELHHHFEDISRLMKYGRTASRKRRPLGYLVAASSAQELLEWVKTNRKTEFPEVQASWPSFLTRAAKDLNGPIMREPSKYGYMLRPSPLGHTPEPTTPVEITPTSPTPAEESPTPVNPTPDQSGQASNSPPAAPSPEGTESEHVKTPREERLYQIFADWLSSNGYQAEDTSTARKGGPWGNPDVVGISATQTISGTVIYELATIEAKISVANWKREFFEAVSHKRFADRVYFAFAYGAETVTVSDIEEYAELREYAEKYRIGIVVVFFDLETYNKLRDGDQNDLNSLSLDEGRVEEVWPAILDPSSPFARDEFVRRVLEITDLDDLYSFGRRG